MVGMQTGCKNCTLLLFGKNTMKYRKKLYFSLIMKRKLSSLKKIFTFLILTKMARFIFYQDIVDLFYLFLFLFKKKYTKHWAVNQICIYDQGFNFKHCFLFYQRHIKSSKVKSNSNKPVVRPSRRITFGPKELFPPQRLKMHRKQWQLHLYAVKKPPNCIPLV